MNVQIVCVVVVVVVVFPFMVIHIYVYTRKVELSYWAEGGKTSRGMVSQCKVGQFIHSQVNCISANRTREAYHRVTARVCAVGNNEKGITNCARNRRALQCA